MDREQKYKKEDYKGYIIKAEKLGDLWKAYYYRAFPNGSSISASFPFGQGPTAQEAIEQAKTRIDELTS